MVDSKVLIAVPTEEFGRRADFYDYINRMNKKPTDILGYLHNRSPARNRNMAVEAAIEYNCSHILFVDDDMVPKVDALDKLREHDVDIVSGIYLHGQYPHQPLIFDSVSAEGSLASYLMPDMPRLVPIKAAGLGFCLIKTQVFMELEKPYFRLGELDPQDWCDDIGFFYRADEAGIKSFCDTQCLVGHIKSMIITPVYKDKKWYTEYDTGAGGSVATPQINPNLLVTK